MGEHSRTRRHRKPVPGSTTATIHTSLQQPPARPVPLALTPARDKVTALRGRFEAMAGNGSPARPRAQLQPRLSRRPGGAYGGTPELDDDPDVLPPDGAYGGVPELDDDSDQDGVEATAADYTLDTGLNAANDLEPEAASTYVYADAAQPDDRADDRADDYDDPFAGMSEDGPVGASAAAGGETSAAAGGETSAAAGGETSATGPRPHHRAWVVAGLSTAYDNEESGQRADLIPVVRNLAEEIRVLDAGRRALGSPPKRKNLAHARTALLMDQTKLFKTPADKYVEEPAVRNATRARDLDRYLARRHKHLTTHLRLQHIEVADDGTLPDLTGRLVKYDRDAGSQAASRIDIEGGALRRSDGKLVDTSESVTHFSSKGAEIFVMSKTGEIHMSSHRIGERQHSSLLAAADIAMAGEIKVVKGKIAWISSKSGHYRPSLAQLLQFLHFLEKDGVSLDFDVREGFDVPAGKASDLVTGTSGGGKNLKASWDYLKTEAAFEALAAENGIDRHQVQAATPDDKSRLFLELLTEALRRRGYIIAGVNAEIVKVTTNADGDLEWSQEPVDAAKVLKEVRGELKARHGKQRVKKNMDGKHAGWA